MLNWNNDVITLLQLRDPAPSLSLSFRQESTDIHLKIHLRLRRTIQCCFRHRFDHINVDGSGCL